MTAYASPARSMEAAPSVVQPRATITRRAALEMSLPTPRAVAVGQTSDIAMGQNAQLPGEFDLNLDLDVPAFLRRNEG